MLIVVAGFLVFVMSILSSCSARYNYKCPNDWNDEWCPVTAKCDRWGECTTPRLIPKKYMNLVVHKY